MSGEDPGVIGGGWGAPEEKGVGFRHTRVELLGGLAGYREALRPLTWRTGVRVGS